MHLYFSPYVYRPPHFGLGVPAKTVLGQGQWNYAAERLSLEGEVSFSCRHMIQREQAAASKLKTSILWGVFTAGAHLSLFFPAPRVENQSIALRGREGE